jgi:hypothetical protein
MIIKFDKVHELGYGFGILSNRVRVELICYHTYIKINIPYIYIYIYIYIYHLETIIKVKPYFI